LMISVPPKTVRGKLAVASSPSITEHNGKVSGTKETDARMNASSSEDTNLVRSWGEIISHSMARLITVTRVTKSAFTIPRSMFGLYIVGFSSSRL
jgi:hypothetical protein